MTLPVTKAAPDPLRERRIRLLTQLATAGPERFRLQNVFSTVDSDYDVLIIDNDDETFPLKSGYDAVESLGNGQIWWLNETGKLEDVANSMADSVTVGICGRTACLAGHAEVAHWRETGKWIGYDEACRQYSLPGELVGMYVPDSHPFSDVYNLMLDQGHDQQFAEWLVSIAAVQKLIDDGDGLPVFQPVEHEPLYDEADAPY